MKEFPVELIKPINANLSGTEGNVSIVIKLMPFKLKYFDEEVYINTSIRLDFIEISNNPNELESKSFSFPVNPEEGYVDGAIYMMNVHNPIDVKLIQFSKIDNKKLPLKLKTFWVMEYEGTEYKNFELEINTFLEM